MIKKYNEKKCYNCKKAIMIKKIGEDKMRKPEKKYECTSKQVNTSFYRKI